jgi:hypothetical protein
MESDVGMSDGKRFDTHARFEDDIGKKIRFSNPRRRREALGAQVAQEVGHLDRRHGRLAALVAHLAAGAVERLYVWCKSR